MKSTLKAVVATGAAATLMAVFGGEAEAEPALSSWYGPGLEGSVTASGELYRADAYTAAHPSLPFGTKLLVAYGKQRAVVRVTDRGPFVEDRDLDLSQAAAEEIGLTAAGADAVDVRVLPGSDNYGRASRRDHAGGTAHLLERYPYLKVLDARPRGHACYRA